MDIATFLEAHRTAILAEAIAFARTLPALHEASEDVLADHLPKLLEVISEDLRSAQTRAQSITKSHGNAPDIGHRTAAQTHGLLRAQSGISIGQLVAELRALRSSILRLYGDAASPGPTTVADIGRFNEAIDQAVAESVQFYEDEVERWRNIFLGVLAHDLRNPLNALALSTQHLERLLPAELSANMTLIRRSVKRLTSMLNSLMELNRAALGAGMVLHTSAVDLNAACAEEVELLRAALPDAPIDYDASGPTHGTFDASRVRQALGNLVANAAKHGDPHRPIQVLLEGDATKVRLVVENEGALDQADIPRLFEPLKRGAHASADRTHLGLGLFITRQIARAHGGDVSAASNDGRVRFVLELPRAATQDAGHKVR